MWFTRPIVAVWVIRGGGNFPGPEKLIDLRAKTKQNLEAVDIERAKQGSREGNIPVDDNLGCALNDELRCCRCQLSRSVTETTGDETCTYFLEA